MKRMTQGAQKPRRPRPPRIVVEVTEEIIARSEQRSSAHCMLAEAVKHAVPTARTVAVDLQTIRFSDPATRFRYVYLTPARCQVALVMFDRGLHTDPFKFVLRGAQVVRMAEPDPRPRPEGKGVALLPEGLKRELVGENATTSSPVPRVSGGKAPPTAALSNTRYAGQRRAFGLRKLRV